MPLPPGTRAIPQNLNLMAPAPFMSRYSYATGWPLADIMTTPEFFLNVRNNLRPGDTIELARFKNERNFSARDNRILETCEVYVIEVTNIAIELHMKGSSGIKIIVDPATLTKPDDPPPPDRFVPHGAKATVEWKGPAKKYTIFVGDAEVCDGIEDKELAHAVAKREKPIPNPPKAKTP